VRIIAADSGTALLDKAYRPKVVLTAAAVLVEEPFTQPTAQHFRLIEEEYGKPTLLLHELQVIAELCARHSCDVIHVDASLGGAALETLSLVDILGLRITPQAKQAFRTIYPKLRKMVDRLYHQHGVSILAIGKDSVAVRIAELATAAYSVVAMATRAAAKAELLILGLPRMCTIQVQGSAVRAASLEPGEHELIASVEDRGNAVERVRLREFPNPFLRGYRILVIEPQGG